MEAIKTTSNLEFDVIYADGTRKRVNEGVLLEIDGIDVTFHNGTNRCVVLFASAAALLDVICMLGLWDAFFEFFDARTVQEGLNGYSKSKISKA